MGRDIARIFERALPVSVIVVVFVLGALALRPFAPALLWAVFTSVALMPQRRQKKSGLRTL